MNRKLDVIKNYWRKEGEKDLDGVMACYDPEATFTAPMTEVLKGAAEIREFYAAGIDGYKSSRVEIVRTTESGDRLAVEYVFHFEQYDGKIGAAYGCNMFTLRSGKIHEVRCYFDPADFAAQ